MNVIPAAPWEAVLRLLNAHGVAEVSASRRSWATGRSVMRGPKGLGLVLFVRGRSSYTFEPHSVDERASDWVIVLPLSEA
jgi:hypothetical protein